MIVVIAMANVTPTVLLVTRDPQVRFVTSTLQAEGISSRSVSSIRELQRALGGPKTKCVAVLDGELITDPNFPAAEFFERLRTVPLLVLLPAEGDLGGHADPERLSVEEYARKPIVPSVLALRIKALILAAGLALPTTTTAAAPAPRQGPLDMGDDPLGQLTVVFSVKGGSGKSTIAVNLAVGLASIYSFQTLLVDANLWFGDIGVLLNLTSTRSSFDVCGDGDADIFALPKAVVPHSSGAAVLLRPPDPLSVEKLRLKSFVEALERYRSLYEHVIVDTSSALDELNLDLLESATRILLVVTPEMGALHNTARFLGLAERLGIKDKLSLVLNRSNSGISSEDLQRTLGIPVANGVVSAGRIMLDAVNEGTTLIAMDPNRRERITQDLVSIVEVVAGREQPPVNKQQQRSRGSALRFLRRSA
jgi:MinD-like ATPase involved in chromosome partitioning or flagellar assembly